MAGQVKTKKLGWRRESGKKERRRANSFPMTPLSTDPRYGPDRIEFRMARPILLLIMRLLNISTKCWGISKPVVW